jgi:hypothetical protein
MVEDPFDDSFMCPMRGNHLNVHVVQVEGALAGELHSRQLLLACIASWDILADQVRTQFVVSTSRLNLADCLS